MRLLELRQRGVLGQEALRSNLWRKSQAHFLKKFREVAEELRVGWLCTTLYVLRHGGASKDLALARRSFEEIGRRGRWAHISSVRHYERHGRQQWLVNKVDKGVVARGLRAKSSFTARLRVF